MIHRGPHAVKGQWSGKWSDDRNSYTGTFTAVDGRKFEGTADWLSERVRDVHTGSGDVLKQVKIAMTPVWEFSGTFMRKDGKGATAPFHPVPPEERDDGEPPPESDDEPPPPRRSVPEPKEPKAS
jgi:hypothetical protein